jgi:predicted transposase/invertase (TIGR01784 family)
LNLTNLKPFFEFVFKFKKYFLFYNIISSKKENKMRIYAKSDPIFKMIFGDPENKTALIGLLREIIDIPEEEYAHIEIIDPNLRVNKSYGKSGILDIKLTTKNGQRINIEIQIRKASDLKQRILFYASKMIAEQLTEGEKYDKMRRVISIMICTDHNLIEDSKEYHNRYFLYDKNTNSTFTDLLEIDILEFKKVPEKDKSNLATWLRFLNTDDKEELDKMAVRNVAFESAVCKYKQLTTDERIRMIAENEEKAWKDRQAELDYAMNEGRYNQKIEIAKNLLDMFIPVDQIKKATGLSKEEIEKLR